MMDKLQHKWRQTSDAARLALSRLTEREQLSVVGALAMVGILLLVGIGFLVGRAIHREQHRVDIKVAMLGEVIALQGDYQVRQAEQAQRLQQLQKSPVRLVSWVEEAGRQAGIEIGQLRPEDGEPGPNGVVESRVDLRAAGLSVDRLQEFLNRLTQHQALVFVRHLKVVRPYRKDTLEIEASVSTFKIKG